MVRYVNSRDTLFKQANLTPIHVKPTFKTLHKIWNKIKANAKSIYSNIRGGSYGHLSLVLANVQYALISNTPFVYPNNRGPLIIPDDMTSHMNSNMHIVHTKEVRLFRELTVVEQSLVQNTFPQSKRPISQTSTIEPQIWSTTLWPIS